MRTSKSAQFKSHDCWSLRDWIAASALFAASAAVVLWQNAHLAVLWDTSYILDTSARIALGQMPYRDFPLAHAPLTFLIQAAIIRLAGRAFFHHVLYAAIVGGLGTVLAWRIALHTLQGRLRACWPVSLLLAAPLAVLGIYSILPFPFYDCDCVFCILVVMLLLQRMEADSAAGAIPAHAFLRPFLAGVALPLPLFFKQNIGLPLLAAALALVFLLLIARLVCRSRALQATEKELNFVQTPEKHPSGAKARPLLSTFCGTTKVLPCYKTEPESSFSPVCKARVDFAALTERLKSCSFKTASFSAACLGGSAVTLGAVLAGAVAMLAAAGLLLHYTAGVGNYIHWTIQFASQRRLPGFQQMLAVYAEPSLLWWLPTVAVALVLLRSRLARALWARLAALGLLAAPFVWTLASLFLSSDAGDRASNLLALWPLLLILSGALTLWNLCREPGLRALLPAILLVTINGTLLSQQLWGSTYAIWPLLVLLIAEMIAFLASIEPAGAVTETTHRSEFLAPALAAILSATLFLCGGLYMASEERLSYAQLPEGPVAHSAIPALKGMSVLGPFLPEFEKLLRFAANEIPVSDGLILIPGEDPFYFATGRAPQFPVLLFDNATDPYSPAQLAAEARRRNIRWLIVKRDLQLKEDPTPQRAASLDALRQFFLPYRELGGYDVYRRP